MCKSQEDGGQRCAAHTRPAYREATPGTPEWDTAAAEYASTPSGAKELWSELENARQAGDQHREVALSHALAQGAKTAEANREARRAAHQAREVLQATKNPMHAYTLTSGDDGETLVTRFCCENHDAPGNCTPECADLVALMDNDFETGPVSDPEGVLGGPPRPYDTYAYNPDTRASTVTTHVPDGEVLAYTVQPGQRVYVDGHERLVDSVAPAGRHGLWIDYAGPDLEPDGTPVAYFSREHKVSEVFGTVD